MAGQITGRKTGPETARSAKGGSRLVNRGLAVMATIGNIISALDDRNLLPAIRSLEPVDRNDWPEPRCTRCITRGE